MSSNKLDAKYYQKLVDCQWACPAHTPVPEYIRLVAQGRYDDAYIVNRESNVFPGILGRICDRPCEPACRRGRLADEAPVAICRLKRVAADYRGDIKSRLPKIPAQKNGHKIALIGAGPASLTVANDLLPLGYSVTIFDKEQQPGGAMRVAVPQFRLPESVLNEEIQMILDMGVETRFGAPVHSLRKVLDEGFSAVFVGTGAPIGKDLLLPGRKEAAEQVQVGLTWLANVAFGHVTKVAPRVLVIGGGNTAMDCARTAKRLGAQEVSIVAPEAFDEMLASPWEKEDAIAEEIPFVNHLLPKSFVIDAGKMVGACFIELAQCYDAQKKWHPVPVDPPRERILNADLVILAIGQTTAFPFIERDLGIEFTADGQRVVVDETTLCSTHERVFFGGDSAFGPKNIIWAVAHGHEAAISIDNYLQGRTERPVMGLNLISQKMGIHDWSYDNQFSGDERRAVPHLPLNNRFNSLDAEVELGFDPQLALVEAQRCLNCDVQTVFAEALCIECDACIDICPVTCLTIAAPGEPQELAQRLTVPARNYPDQELMISSPLAGTGRVMAKDEDICLHCGLCAERCPTGAWDMQRSITKQPKAGGR